jgi:hypothetical protein
LNTTVLFNRLKIAVWFSASCPGRLSFPGRFLNHFPYENIFHVFIIGFLYGCETWSLTLRDEHRLRVFENRVLRRILGPKRDEVTGEWRKLQNEELRDLYSSPSIIRIINSRRMRWAGYVARMGERGTRIGYWWESQRERDR